MKKSLNRRRLTTYIIAFVTTFTTTANSTEVIVNPGECEDAWCISRAEHDEFSGSSECEMRISDKQISENYRFMISVTRGGDMGRSAGLGNNPYIEFFIFSRGSGYTGQLNGISLMTGHGYSAAGYKIDNGRFKSIPSPNYIDIIGTGRLASVTVVDNELLRSLKKGNYILFKLSGDIDAAKLPLKGFTRAYNLCRAVMGGKANIISDY